VVKKVLPVFDLQKKRLTGKYDTFLLTKTTVTIASKKAIPTIFVILVNDVKPN